MFTNSNLRFIVSNLPHQVELDKEHVSSTLGKDIDSYDWASFKNYCQIVFGPSQDNQFDLVEELYFSEAELIDNSFIKKTVNQYITQIFAEFVLMEQLKRVPLAS